MMQNPFDQFDSAPSGPILGPAPKVDPYKARDQQLQEDKARRDAERDALTTQKDILDIKEKQKKIDDGDVATAVGEERKASAFLIRALGANKSYEGLDIGPRSLVGQSLSETFPDAINSLPAWIGNSPNRQVADANQDEFIAASLRQDSGAAIPPEELERQRRIYFPMPGDSEQVIRAKQQARMRAIEGLKQSSGKLLDETLARYQQMQGGQNFGITVDPNLADENGVIVNPAPNTPSPTDPYQGVRRPEMRGDVPVGTDVTFGDQNAQGFDRSAYLRSLGIDPNQEASVMAFYNANRGNPNLTAESVLKFYADAGATPPSPADILKAIEDAKAGKAFGPIDTSQAEAEYRARVSQAADTYGLVTGESDYGERFQSGATMGLQDELAGVGGGISALLQGENPADAYRFQRDVQRERYRQADENTGLTGDLTEIGSSMLVPFGAARTAGQAARVGATAGAVGGFGYGEGAKGSGLNALLGAGAGAALGAGAQKAGNALATRAANRAAQGQNTNALLQAADNLQIDRPGRMFTDPTLQNRARAVAGTIAGGAKVQGGVRKLGSDIEGSVSALSPGNAIADNEAAGGVVRNAAERFIKTSGDAARKQYDQAERLAGDAKMPATEGLKIIDELQARLGELPNENKAELAYLSGLREDLSKNVSVGALRDLRTTLRKKISKGELTFGQNEQRVLDIMKATSADIENGLRSNGNSKAAAIFNAADKKYAERMDYINNTLQKVIGKRNSSLSNEDVFRKLRSLTKADSASLRKFYTTLSPDEAADVSATFAEALGRGGSNGTKDFSTATLIDNIEALKKSGSSIETMFGPQGAKALKDIELLAREHKRVNGAIAGQGSAQGNDWRWTLASMFIPGVGGLATSGSSSAIAAGVAGLVVKAGRDAISAKMLLSPKITNWARVAPRTNSPKAINAHWDKLSAIAKAEPALAADIDAFRNAVMQAANDNANKAVAEDRQSESMR